MNAMNKKFTIGQMYYTFLSSFAYTVLISSVFQTIFNGGNMSVLLIGQIAAISVITALLQSLFFTTAVLKKASYPLRIFGFLFLLLLALSAFAYFFTWFPTSVLLSWLIFIGVFILIGGIITTALTLYYARKGREYTEQLRNFQENEAVE